MSSVSSLVTAGYDVVEADVAVEGAMACRTALVSDH
jgi:hypothetical protein